MSITLLGVISICLAVIIILCEGISKCSDLSEDIEDLELVKLPSILDFVGPATFLFTIHYCVLSMGSEVLITASKTTDIQSLDESNSAGSQSTSSGDF